MNVRQEIEIIKHGKNLNKIFKTDLEPMALCRKLRRIEVKGNKMALDWCNGDIDQEEWDQFEKETFKKLRSFLNWNEHKMRVFLNGDARGYTLKISDKSVRDLKLDIHTDWGGYGIIAPEITGE